MIAVLIIVTVPSAGCSSSGGDSCPAPTPLEAGNPLARSIAADRLGTVTSARSIPGLDTLTIESDDSVADLRRSVPRALGRIGLDRLSEENEGFEAEIYFGGRQDASGVASIRENALCPERTTVQLSVTGWAGSTR